MTAHPKQTAGRGSELTAIDWNVLDALKVLQKPGKPDVRGKLIDSYLSSSPSLLERAKTAVTEADGPRTDACSPFYKIKQRSNWCHIFWKNLLRA